MLRTARLPAVLLLFSLNAAAQEEAVELKLHWEPGQTYVQESDTDTVNFLTAIGKTSDQKLRLHQTTRITVSKNASDQTEAQVLVESLLGEMTYEGQTHAYDSKNPASSHPLLQRSFGGAAGRSFTLVYDVKDQFIDAKDAASGVDPDLVEIANARQLADLYRRSLEMGLPSIPVHPGDKWISEQIVVFPQAGSVEVKLNSKFDGVVEREGRRQAQIAFEGLMKTQRDKDGNGRELPTERPVSLGDDSKVNGHIFFDLERRTISLAVFSATLQLKIEGKPLPVRQQVTTRLVSMRPTAAP
ncbi:MAG: hypothetical protein R3F13_13830 [Prosthecobacter sp.]